MGALMFDLLERTLWLCEVVEKEIGDGEEPPGARTCCYFERWEEAARALAAAAQQAQYHLRRRGNQTPLRR